MFDSFFSENQDNNPIDFFSKLYKKCTNINFTKQVLVKKIKNVAYYKGISDDNYVKDISNNLIKNLNRYYTQNGNKEIIINFLKSIENSINIHNMFFKEYMTKKLTHDMIFNCDLTEIKSKIKTIFTENKFDELALFCKDYKLNNECIITDKVYDDIMYNLYNYNTNEDNYNKIISFFANLKTINNTLTEKILLNKNLIKPHT